MNTHELKADPKYFEGLRRGTKTFEIRKNDRDFGTGDMLVLKEYDREFQTYSGRQAVFFVTYILHEFEGLTPGFVALGLGYSPALS
jgi:hypothetical protein